MKTKNALRKIYAFASKHKYVSCAAAGGIYSLAFFCGHLFVTAFAGLVLFFLMAFEKCGNGFFPKKIFRKTFCFSLGFYIPLYSWFYVLYPFEAFGFSTAEGIFIVIAADIGLGVFHSLINSASFCLLYLFPKNTKLLPLGSGCCMMISEFIISNLGFLSFPWGIAAIGVYRFLPLIQIISVVGTYGIALIMGCFCASASVVCRGFRKKELLNTAAYIGVPLIIGGFLLLIPAGEKDNMQHLTVSCVQGNISSMEKWDSDRLDHIIETYVSLAEEAASGGAELVVLPESAIPARLTNSILIKFAYIAEKYETNIIVSGIAFNGDKKYNSVFLINSDGMLYSERYDKQHLVPFGEYIPLKETVTDIFPFVAEINLSSSAFSAGSGSKLFVLPVKEGEPSVTVCPLICFDSIFPSLARENCPSFYVVATNDSWYKDSPGVYQHEAQSVLRAIENGKWVARSANTGVSCFISPKGIIKGELAPLVKGITTEKITFDSSHTTVYAEAGDIILVIPFGFIIYSIGCAVYFRVKRKDENNGNNQTL